MRKVMRKMRMVRMTMNPMIRSCKWRTPLRHLYCWCFGRGDDDADGKDDEDDDDSDDLNYQELQVAHTSAPSVLSMGGRHRKAFEERFGLGFSTACQTIIRMAGICKTFEKLTRTLTLMMARSDHLGRAGGKATSLKPGSYH